MADLDDFFAKKDKKKSKKPKFLTAEELVKNLEETKREVAKAKKPEPTVVAPVAPTVGETVEDKPKEQQVEDEWKEIEEEQRKDYSGLKIGQLTLNDDEEETDSEGQEDDGESDGNQNSDSLKRSGGGPWKKVIPAEEVTQIPMEMPKPVSKVYVSPALRAAQQGLGPGLKPKLRNKAAPDITNADFFPTLGAARPEEQRKKKNEPAFEEVRHGMRVQRVKEQTVAPSAATNRFQSLDETES
ncbi:protein CDV3 homolog isoform X1 [Lucilia cuprina]|uniref:protein CDV3 homolog isoform X1 n=1 Tax=Lucilia cuprina TaxID=7375 RepID=UPI001F051DA7|nr:protein CDV3 homolog isoform X1 [Lucilia cuprina]